MVPEDQFDQSGGLRLAAQVRPIRMVVVTGAFPYRKELEEFRRALRFDSVDSLLSDPQAIPEFMGIDVQRREVPANGEPGEWEPLDIEGSVRGSSNARCRSGARRPRAAGLWHYRPAESARHASTATSPRRTLRRTGVAEHLRNVSGIAERARIGELAPPPAAKSRFESLDPWSDAQPGGMGGRGGMAGWRLRVRWRRLRRGGRPWRLRGWRRWRFRKWKWWRGGGEQGDGGEGGGGRNASGWWSFQQECSTVGLEGPASARRRAGLAGPAAKTAVAVAAVSAVAVSAAVVPWVGAGQDRRRGVAAGSAADCPARVEGMVVQLLARAVLWDVGAWSLSAAQPPGQVGAATTGKTFAPPDKCLLRFLDVTVQPGKTYEYRVKIKIANPTYGKDELAVSKEAASEPVIVAPEWKEVTQRVGEEELPLRVTVADELMYYAVDEKLDQRVLPANSERAAVQVHKWLEEVRVNPRDKSSVVPVGEWAILERLLVHRGEYIGRQEEVDVPVWRTTANGFALAGHSDETPRIPGQRLGKSKGVVVDFATDPVRQNSSVLVDFEGGKLTIRSEDKPVSDESPVEMLVLDASGKLLVHNSVTDTEDRARRQRYDAWKGELVGSEKQRGGPSRPR